MMLSNYDPLHCARCRQFILVPKGLAASNIGFYAAPWRVHEEPQKDGSITVHAYCSEACQAKGPPRPEADRVTAFLTFAPGKGYLTKVGSYDALNGFLTPLSDHPEYLDGHKDGLEFRKMAEGMIKDWPGTVT